MKLDILLVIALSILACKENSSNGSDVKDVGSEEATVLSSFASQKELAKCGDYSLIASIVQGQEPTLTLQHRHDSSQKLRLPVVLKEGSRTGSLCSASYTFERTEVFKFSVSGIGNDDCNQPEVDAGGILTALKGLVPGECSLYEQGFVDFALAFTEPRE